MIVLLLNLQLLQLSGSIIEWIIQCSLVDFMLLERVMYLFSIRLREMHLCLMCIIMGKMLVMFCCFNTRLVFTIKKLWK